MKFEETNNIVSMIMAYENGEMDEGEVIDFFQELLDRNLLNHLQGSYQRHAAALVEQGYIE